MNRELADIHEFLHICEPKDYLEAQLWVCECGRVLYTNADDVISPCDRGIWMPRKDWERWKMNKPGLINKILEAHNVTISDAL